MVYAKHLSCLEAGKGGSVERRWEASRSLRVLTRQEERRDSLLTRNV